MLRRIVAVFMRHFDDMLRNDTLTPEQLGERLRRLMKKPMQLHKLSIDPRGEWSPVQARRVLDVINPEAAAQGLFFDMLDITTHRMPAPRVLLVAFCLQHEIAVADDSICSECKRLT